MGALALLCLGAFALVSLATSAAVGALWALTARWRARLAAAAEARLALAAALAPGCVAGFALACSLVPVWLGWLGDHCLEHAPHHPHLCIRHTAVLSGLPGLPIVILAGFLLARWLHAAALAIRALIQLVVTSRRLRAAAGVQGDLHVLPGSLPEAFVMGLLRPRLYASAGLLAMPDTIIDAVLAHERAHQKRRDPLHMWLASGALACHLPYLARHLRTRLGRCQEMAADAEAAAHLHDPSQVALALVKLARLQHAQPALMTAFAGSSIEERVQRLLGGAPGSEHPGPLAVGVLVLALFAGMAACAGSVHHTVETMLGILS